MMGVAAYNNYNFNSIENLKLTKSKLVVFLSSFQTLQQYCMIDTLYTEVFGGTLGLNQ